MGSCWLFLFVCIALAKFLFYAYNYERLIEDVTGEGEDDEHLIDHLMEVYTSWIDDAISNYTSDFYYQSRDYLFACYQEGEICP